MLCYEVEVAKYVGDRAATVLQQIHYWASKGYGRKIKGRVYIYNTYEDWHKQFPHWSLMTIRRLFEKLVKENLVIPYRKGYDRTSHWSINYSHPICSFCTNGSVQNEQMDMFNLNSSIGTYPSHREPQSLQPVSQQGEKKEPTTKGNYREKYPEAESWLEEKDKEFRQGVEEYLNYHVNNPKVKFPQAYRMAVIVEIWKKYTGQTHHTDFDYIDRSEVKPSNVPVIVNVARPLQSEEFDKEMQNFIEQGGLE